MSVRIKLWLIIIVSIIISLILGRLLIYPSIVDNEMEEITNYIEIEFDQFDNNLSKFLDEGDFLFDKLLDSNELESINPDNITNYLSIHEDGLDYSPSTEEVQITALFEDFTNLNLNTKSIFIGFNGGEYLNGKQTIYNSVPLVRDNFDPREQEWFINSIMTSDVVINRIYKSNSDNTYSIVLSKRIMDQYGETIGVIGVEVDISSFLYNLKIIEANDYGSDSIIDGDRVLIVNSSNEYTIFKLDDFYLDLEIPTTSHENFHSNVQEIGRYNFETHQIERFKAVVTSYKSDFSSMVYLNVIDYSEYETLAAQAVRELILSFTLALGVILIALSIGIRYLVIGPLRKTMKNSDKISKDLDYSVKFDTKRKDEFGAIGKSFNKMLDEIQLKTKMMENRIKEINCLNVVSNSARKNYILADVFQDTIDALERTLYGTNDARVNITFKGVDYQNSSFKKSKNVISSNIISKEEIVGSIEIHYLSESIQSDNPFTEEVVSLLKNVTDTINLSVEADDYKYDLRKRNENFEQQVKDRTKSLTLLASQLEQTSFNSGFALDLSKAGFWSIDFNDKENYISTIRTAKLFGEEIKDDMLYDHKEWLSRITDADPEISEEISKGLSYCIENKLEDYSARFPYKRPNDGKVIWIQSNSKITYNDDSTPKLLYGVNRDITEQIKKDRELEKLVVAVEQSPSAVMITGVDSVIQYVNKEFQTLFGYTYSEVVGQDVGFIDPIGSKPEYYDQFNDKLTHGLSYVGLVQNLRKDGTLFWNDTKSSPVIADNGEILHYVTTKDDVTQKRKDVILLNETQRKIKTALDVAKLAYWEFGLKSEDLIFDDSYNEIIHENKSAKIERVNYVKYFEKYAVKEDFDEVIKFIDNIKKSLDNESIFPTLEIQLNRSEEEIIDVSIKFVKALYDESGKVDGFLAINQVITDAKNAERKIIRTETTYRSLFENSNDAVTIIDSKTKTILDINNAGLDLYGFDTLEEFHNYSGALAPTLMRDGTETCDVIMKAFTDLRETGGSTTDWLVLNKKEELIDTIMIMSPVTYFGKEATQTVFRNVTLEKEQERKLKEQEATFRSLFEKSNDAITIIDTKTKDFLDANPAAIELFGVDSVNDIIGENHTFSPEYQPNGEKSTDVTERTFDELLETGSAKIDWVVMKRDGALVDTRLTLSPVVFYGVQATQIVFRDVTIEKEQERKVQEHEATFRALFEESNDAIQILDLNNKNRLTCNRAALKLYGHDNVKELIDSDSRLSPDYQYNGELSSTIRDRLFKDLEETGGAKSKWLAMNRKGDLIDTIITLSPVVYYGVEAIQVVFRDVTIEKEQERKVKENEENLASIFNSSLDAIMVLDLESTRYVDCNPAAYEMFKIENKEALINTLPESLSPEYQPDGRLSSVAVNDNTNVINEKGTFKTEWLSMRADGTTFPTHLSISSSVYRNKDAVTVIVRDITESKNTERQEKLTVDLMTTLIEKEDLNSKLELISSKIVELFDVEFSRIWVIGSGEICEDCAHMTGGEENVDCKLQNDCFNVQVSKKGFEHYVPTPDVILFAKNTMGKVIEGKVEGFTTNDLRNDLRISNRESMEDLDLKSYAIQVIRYPNGDVAGVIDMFGTKEILDVEFDRFSSLASVAGQVISSSKAEDEIKEAREIAINATKAKSDFLANMSHEIRTPMNAVIGLTRLLETTKLTPKQHDYVVKTNRAATNLLGIINDILDFSKIEAGKLNVEQIEFNLDEVLDNVSSVVSMKAFEKGIEFIVSKNFSNDRLLYGDPLRLGQVLLNLINNAIKFTSKGQVFVKISEEKRTKKSVRLNLSVHDSGIGLTVEQMKKLFEAFGQADTSTTRKYGGTGLGLSISRSLVEKMGGEIIVESEIGIGSAFSFSIEFKLGKDNELDELLIPSKLKKIKTMIIDDNFAAREVVGQYLAGFGIKYVSVESGEIALDLIDKSIKLIILDWSMPGLNGVETWEKIKEKLGKDAPKVIMQTAYGKSEVTDMAVNSGIKTILMKPVNQSTLYNSIMEEFGETITANLGSLNKYSVEGFELVKGAKILVAEDNEINQQVAKETLENEGFFVDLADNGKIACDMAFKNEYDLILMDLQMPIMSGYEASEKIRQSGLKLPIIALSADAMVGVIEKVAKFGMNDYVAKPFNLKDLFGVLVKWIQPMKRDLFVSQMVKDDKVNDFSKYLLGFDYDKAIARLGGNQKAYLNIIERYASDNIKFVENLRINLVKGKKQEIKLDIHTLKGVSGNIGAFRTNKVVVALEKEFLSGADILKADEFIRLEISLIDDINEINNMLSNKTEVVDEIVLNNTELLLELEKLQNQLSNFETSSKVTIEYITKPLKDLKITGISKLVKLVNDYDFDNALIICESIIVKVEENSK